MSTKFYAIVSNLVAKENASIDWLYREEPDDETDSGWRMFHGNETEEYMNSPENFSVVSLDFILEKHN